VSATGYHAPALIWRAFLLMGWTLASTAWAGPASKTNRPPPDFVQLRPPDQTEGARILREFRGLGIAGDYYIEFELQVRPRRGDEQIFKGRLWGGRNGAGPISRVVLYGADGTVQRFLIQNGPAPRVWRWQAGQAKIATGSLDELFKPLLPETDLTLFDLQMPYLYWSDFVFEGVSKVRGRPAHTFLLYPPEAIAVRYPELHGVRVELDTQFHALVQSALIGADNAPYKTLSVLDLKKVGDQWMVKTIDLRNESTRNKTRFEVTQAALNLDLSPEIFSPGALDEQLSAPDGLVSLGQ
jgi:hypothetical protein